MKAFVYEKYGNNNVLEMREVEKPVAEDNQVCVKIYAVCINDWDLGLIKGKPFVNRILNGICKPKKQIVGSDIAGIVESVGENTYKFKPGDEVYGDLSGYWGGFAEYVCVPEDSLCLKSPKMTFKQAASIPQAGTLAVQGLIDAGQIKKNQKILINGAGGGVGTFSLQIAKQYNAEITGVDNSVKSNFLKSIGFDHVIDYTKEDFTKNGRHYDLILDVKTNRSVFCYINSLNPDGRYVTVGGEINKLLKAAIFGPFINIITKKKIKTVGLKYNKDLPFFNEQFEAGKIKPVIDNEHLYTFNELPEALNYYETQYFKGKIVITIAKSQPKKTNNKTSVISG